MNKQKSVSQTLILLWLFITVGILLINTHDTIVFFFSRVISGLSLISHIKKKKYQNILKLSKMMQKIVISSVVVAIGFLLFVSADVSHLGESKFRHFNYQGSGLLK
jgi:hypothetical protein